MKKLLIIIFAFLIPAISSASIDINLKYGSQGTEVRELQEFLIDKGFLSGQTTGNFYTLTRKAVVAYQNSIGLPNTGFVGPMTREKINTELAQADSSSNQAEVTETGTTALPTKSNSVTAMQEQINALLAQLHLLNAQVKTQTTVQQQIQTTLQQTQQNTQQIQQNTTPTPPPPTPTPTPAPTPTPSPAPVVVPEVVKTITIETQGIVNITKIINDPPQFILYVTYTEDGIPKVGIPVTLTSDRGMFGNDSNGNYISIPLNETKLTQHTVTGVGTYVARAEFNNNGPRQNNTGDYVFTATANGVSATKTVTVIDRRGCQSYIAYSLVTCNDD